MIYRVVGLKIGPTYMWGDSPEDALANELCLAPRAVVVRIVRTTRDEVVVQVTGEESAHGAYMRRQSELPRDPRSACERRHMVSALSSVGNNATAIVWEERLRLRRSMCPSCNAHARKIFGRVTPKKPIVNTVVRFGQKTKAHWDSENAGCTVSEYSRRGGSK